MRKLAWLVALLLLAVGVEAQDSIRYWPSPTAPSTNILVDEFIGGTNVNSTIGVYSWSFLGGSMAVVAGESGHPGIMRHTSAASANSALYLNSGAYAILPADLLSWQGVVRGFVGANVSTKRIGLVSDITADPPGGGIYFEALTTDTNWFAVTRHAGTATRTDTNVAFANNTWYRLAFKKSGTTIQFILDGVTVATHSGPAQNVTTTACMPTFQNVGTGTATNLDIDYFEMTVTPRPIVTSPIGGTYFVFTIDDGNSANLQYISDVGDALEAVGGRVTAFMQPAYLYAAEWPQFAALAAEGHEMAIHSWSHSDLATATAFDVTSTNTNPTVDVDVGGTQLVLSCDEVGNRVTVSWSASDKTIADLQAAVVGKGWTITATTHISTLLKLSSLSDSSGAQTVPETLALDISAPDYAFWREEIADAMSWVQSKTGVAVTTQSMPWGTTTAGLIDYQRATAGLLGARGVVGAAQLLRSVPIYDVRMIYSDAGHIKGDGSEAQIRERARSYYALAAGMGALLVFLSHNDTELSVVQAGWLIDEIHQAGGQWSTFGQAMAAIRTSHSTVDSETYTLP